MSPLASLMIVALTASSPATRSACIVCHGAEKDSEMRAPVLAFADDLHAQRGLGCHDCHGGDPAAAPDDQDAAHDESKGFLGAPDPTDVPALCGRCHADIDFMRTYNPRARVDQLDEYRTSMHGKKNAEGDERVATCSSCHGNHGVLAVSNPRAAVYPSNVAKTCARCHADTKLMDRYQLPSNQFALWQQSVHGKAMAAGELSAPTCNGCHGNHGAAPPGVKAIGYACGHCHSREQVLFAASPLKAPWEKLGLGECIKCHGNHDVQPPSDLMVGSNTAAVCTTCHEHGKVGLSAAAAVRGSYDRLSRQIGQATDVLDRAERMGMEVSSEKFALIEARDALVEARVLLHSFSVPTVEAKVNEGLKISLQAERAGEEALRQLGSRRLGLAVSVLFILAAIAALWLKVRSLERDAG